MKKILITGGNSGIGYATAKLCKARGYDVTISGRDSEKVALAAEELKVQGVVANMGSMEDLRSLAAKFDGAGLDALVNNAALARFMPITAHTERDFEEFFSVNVRGPMALIQLLLPALRKKQGSVTNISSAVVNNGLPNASLYAATKGAMDAFARSLAIELAGDNVRVNVVSPGAIDTPILQKLGMPVEQIAAIKIHQEQTVIPMHRYGKPEEVAHVILAQIEATYVTGAVWSVDGGVDAQ